MSPRALCLVVMLVTGHALAADTTTLSLVNLSNTCDPAFCNPQSFKKGYLKIRTSDSSGSNGIRFKWVMTGGMFNGAPANTSLLLHVNLAVHFNGACTEYTTPPTAMTDGTLRASFSASDFVSPIPESPGLILIPCGNAFGANAVWVETVGFGEAPAVAGIRIGSDDD